MAKNNRHDDEAERRRLQEYIFSLEEIQEQAEKLSAEHARLKRSQEELARHVPLGFLSIDKDGHIIEVNRRMLEILGSPDEDATKSINVLTFQPLVDAGISGTLSRCLKEGQVISAEAPYVSTWGKSSYLREFLVPTLDTEGKVCGCQVAVQDISAQKRAEEALRESEERYRLLTQYSLTGIYIVQNDIFVYVNGRMAQMFGFAPEEMIGSDFWGFVHHDDRRLLKERGTRGPQAHEAVPEHEFRGRCKDGSERWFHLLSATIPYKGHPAEMGNVADITSRKRVEDALRESQERYKDLYEISKRGEDLYRTLLDSSPDAVVVYDMMGRARYVNDSFTRTFGWTLDEVQSKRVPFVPNSERDSSFTLIQSVIQDGVPCHGFETKRYTKDGDLLDISISASRYHDHDGCPLGMLVILSDITERKRLEEQLRQSAKMEAIGRLAGGVAHDFNNLLTAIIGYSDLLDQNMSDEDPDREKVVQINRAAQHAASLTRQLLAFSRKQVLEVKVLGLNEIIAQVENMLHRLIGEQIVFVTRFSQSLGKVRADPSQIEQVLMNLAVNARDAMPEGGILTIATANAILTRESSQSRDDVQPGAYVMFSVTDTGIGMDSETALRVFDPFFTTKAQGSSAGLGLSTVYGIVKQHGGHVDVESKLGKGTIFKVYLPRVEETSESIERVSQAPLQPRGKETILVVEDEDVVRELACEALQTLGYDTLNASGPEEALTLCQTYEGEIQLLLTDVVLPKMDGKSLFDRISATMPHLKVLYMSGYTDDAIVRHGVLTAGVHFLQKPFTMDGLAIKVREVLDTATPSPDL
jgi:two-component system cell cycle sensor histidine kinase/response regulator CckA